ncbi:hypothetical protein ACMU_06360 [Actibacterium mucosum KCTC 23349]|uniref:Uncharacterized protein n=1 Tax=Actibacterium mucosum KCTC 23349 TaxID=1454373 RepID=A0A037ZP15_9RHOB|nr:hypothetical protein [Actibacterium mucosum]KAJ56561.1 hypothetical protein ACMU_06360 [Actibacterium mucosum KCTC 23349]
MNALVTTDSGVTIVGKVPLVCVTETKWGYVIRSDSRVSQRAALIERVSAMTGLAFMSMAFGSWLIPEVQAAGLSDTSVRMASTATLAIPALMFLWIAERGMAQDFEVDLRKSEIRLSVCNRAGRARVLKQIPFDQVGSAYIKRASNHGANARLFLRLQGKGGVVEVASGRESTMRVLHERLSYELRPQRIMLRGWERVGRRLKPVVVD